MGPDAMILVFWILSFKPAFSLSSLTLIKRLFSSSSLSATRVVSFAYLRLLIFLPAILILACASSSPACYMMYTAYNNKQIDIIPPQHTPFPICNQSILKEISLEYSLEVLMLKLKLQYFGHLIRRTDSFKKTLILGKIEGRRRRGLQRIRWLGSITNSIDMSLSKPREWRTWKPDVLQSMEFQRVRHDLEIEQQKHSLTSGFL